MSRRIRFRLGRALTLLALACGLLILASCRISLPNDCTDKCTPSAPPISAVPVLFDASVSYADALRGMTDLGVQPAVFCGYPSDVAAGKVIESKWLPAGQRDRFQQEHRMWVVQTITGQEWLKIYKLSGFHTDSSSQNYGCSDGHANAGPPPPKVAPDVLTLNPADNQVLEPLGIYAYVTFAAGVDYDTALYDVSNLGLRLADPCYEQSLLPHQHPQQWHPMGQEITFSYSHALVVAPVPLVSAVTWRDQLHKLPDVASSDTSYHAVC